MTWGIDPCEAGRPVITVLCAMMCFASASLAPTTAGGDVPGVAVGSATFGAWPQAAGDTAQHQSHSEASDNIGRMMDADVNAA